MWGLSRASARTRSRSGGLVKEYHDGLQNRSSWCDGQEPPPFWYDVPWDTESTRAYQRKYQLSRYHKFRSAIVDSMGGKCVMCGSADRLEIDHIDPGSKSMHIGKSLKNSSAALKEELAKCQLLCKPCHTEKTISDMGHISGRGKHGTVASYRYCRCDLCRSANAAKSRGDRARKRRK